MTGLAALELRRAIRMRWLGATAVAVSVYAAAIGPTGLPPRGIPHNQWDVVMHVLALPVALHVLCLCCALMASEVLWDARSTGVDALVAVRRRIGARWTAKVIAVMVAGIASGLVLWACAIVVGLWVSTPEWQASTWGLLSYDPLGSELERIRPYGPPPFVGVPALGTALVAAYQGAGVGFLVAVVAATCQAWGLPWVLPPITLGAALVMQGLGLGAPNPLSQLTWTLHHPSADGHLMWWTAWPVLGTLAAVAFGLGPRTLASAQRRA